MGDRSEHVENELASSGRGIDLFLERDMARITRELREAGTQIADEGLAHVWPLQHARIISNGAYFLNWPELTNGPFL